MKNKLKNFGKALALAAAFTAVASPALAQNAPQPEPAKTYASLMQTIDRLGDASKQIEMTVHTQDVLGLPTNTPEIAQLRQQLKKDIAAEAPRIILAQGLSGPNIQSLINRYEAKVGTLPDYLAKVDGHARFVPVCHSQLVTAEDATSAATARDVANCVESKQGVEDKTAAAPQAGPAVIQQQEVKPPVPVKQQQPAPVITQPAPVVTQPAPVVTQPQPQADTATIMQKIENLDAKTLGIAGGGVAVLGLGAVFGIRRLRRKPIDAYVPVEQGSVDTPSVPEAPKEKEPFRIKLAPNKQDPAKRDDTPYTPPPKKFNI